MNGERAEKLLNDLQLQSSLFAMRGKSGRGKMMRLILVAFDEVEQAVHNRLNGHEREYRRLQRSRDAHDGF